MVARTSDTCSQEGDNRPRGTAVHALPHFVLLVVGETFPFSSYTRTTLEMVV